MATLLCLCLRPRASSAPSSLQAMDQPPRKGVEEVLRLQDPPHPMLLPCVAPQHPVHGWMEGTCLAPASLSPAASILLQQLSPPLPTVADAAGCLAWPARAVGAVGLCLDGAWTTEDVVCTLHPLKACKFTAKPLALCPPPPVNKQAHARWAGRQVSIAGRAEGGLCW